MSWRHLYIFISSSLQLAAVKEREDTFINKPLRIKVKRLPIKWLAVAVIVLTASCKEPFDPGIRPEQTNFLVVEGFINAHGVTNITLGRTGQLKDTGATKRELGATITIIGEDNTTVQLPEKAAGLYQSDSVTLDKNLKYRLLIKTLDSKEYLSASVAIKPTPPIDSISWKHENNGIQVYANTHDPQNNTKYYKWDYEETWEVHSAYEARFTYENGNVSPVDPLDASKFLYCWQSQNSENILINSTAQLASDVISMAPISFIPDGSIKTNVRYSILVKQYSLDRQSYDFYQLMKKNTESVGYVFDALPSEVTGNIVCVSNPEEKVIGYINASTVEQKRIFISKEEVPGPSYSQLCQSLSVANNRDSFQLYYDGLGFRPYGTDILNTVYYSSFPECIDCRLRGTNIKPVFW